MCRVNVTEFRNNIFHYLDLCVTEGIQITKNGEVVAVLSGPDSKYYEALTNLCGCLQKGDDGSNYDDLIGEEILRRCGY